ncbi:MAG: hypothetical protein ACO1O4_06010 [Devosia sp.]
MSMMTGGAGPAVIPGGSTPPPANRRIGVRWLQEMFYPDAAGLAIQF